MTAPCRVPIEIRATGEARRVFHLARALAPRHIELLHPLPEALDWLRGPLEVRFHLPGDELSIACTARAGERVFDAGTEHEHAALGALELEDLGPEAAQRIEHYVQERLEQA